MNKILVTDPIHPDAITYLRKEGFVLDLLSHPTVNELLTLIPNYEALICRTSTKITREILQVASNLKCIGVHATGWDHIDIETATKRNILLLGYPSNTDTLLKDRYEGSFVPVAEYVLMTMLAISKKLIEADTSMKSGHWDKYSLSGTELYGKTLGIIGLGRIGSLVAQRASAFGMRVIAHHPRLTPDEALKRGAELVSIKQIYKESDYITVHIPNTSENLGFINSSSFAQMQRSPVLINTSRSATVVESDILPALVNKQLGAVVLDVFDNAPQGINWDLVRHPKVIATPHIAGVTDESLKRVSTHISKIVTDYLKYGKISGLIGVNPPM